MSSLCFMLSHKAFRISTVVSCMHMSFRSYLIQPHPPTICPSSSDAPRTTWPKLTNTSLHSLHFPSSIHLIACSSILERLTLSSCICDSHSHNLYIWRSCQIYPLSKFCKSVLANRPYCILLCTYPLCIYPTHLIYDGLALLHSVPHPYRPSMHHFLEFLIWLFSLFSMLASVNLMLRF